MAENLALLDTNTHIPATLAAALRQHPASQCSAPPTDGGGTDWWWRLVVAARLGCCSYLVIHLLASLAPLHKAGFGKMGRLQLPGNIGTLPAPPLPMLVQQLYGVLRPLKLCNHYSKFAGMHDYRWELQLEGFASGAREWRRYGWRYKPWDPGRCPAVVPLHLPRLDWRIWFLPLAIRRQGRRFTPPPWLGRLAEHVLAGENTAVLDLLLHRQHQPFRARGGGDGGGGGEEERPLAVRFVVSEFRFAAPGAPGWWVESPAATTWQLLEVQRRPSADAGTGRAGTPERQRW